MYGPAQIAGPANLAHLEAAFGIATIEEPDKKLSLLWGYTQLLRAACGPGPFGPR